MGKRRGGGKGGGGDGGGGRFPHPGQHSGVNKKDGKRSEKAFRVVEVETAPEPSAKSNPQSRTSSTTRAHLTSASFASLGLSPLTARAVAEVLRYETMTLVQEATLPVALQGKDVIAKAKTGTGKTIGFLLPTIERLVASGARGGAIHALAISPTRELASQIREEAEQLLTFHKQASGFSSLVVVGGTNVSSDIAKLRARPPTLLVATPGRLNDLLANHGLDKLVASLRTLIFDEADQLLEMGFRPDVERILNALRPSASTRQTLLFSATLPKDVLAVAKFATRDALLVDTVGDEEQQTNEHVPQCATVTPLKAQAAELLALLRALKRGATPHKIVVFFATARLTQLYAEAFAQYPCELPVLEMHSRRSQSQRTRVADQFREGSNLIMFSSDVSARGMDYPDVTAVIQVGMPSERAQYIHRLGRTGRAGKQGGGYLLLAEEERPALKMLADLPITTRAPLDAPSAAALTADVAEGMLRVSAATKQASYQAWLGFYNTFTKRLGWSKEECVRRANLFSSIVLGLASPPAIEVRTAGKMGLTGVKGLAPCGLPY